MAKQIRNITELEKALQPVMSGMADKLAERVYETLDYYLDDYYTGWTPESYRRTEAFLRSAVKISAKPYKNGVRAMVYIDTDAMDDYVNATGFQVAEWANSGFHGGISVQHSPHVWDDTIKNTVNNGELLKMAVQYLKNNGIPVSVI